MTSLLLRIWYVDLVSRAASWTLFLPPVPFLSLSVSLSVVRWIRPSGHFQFGRNKKRRFFMWGKKRIWPEKSGFPVFSVKLPRRTKRKKVPGHHFVCTMTGRAVCVWGGRRTMCCAAMPLFMCTWDVQKKSVSGCGKRRGGQGAPCPNYETPRIREMQVCV